MLPLTAALLFLQLTDPPRRPARLEGQVVNSVTGGPVSKVRVIVTIGTGQVAATSDAQGHFEMPDLPAGSYSLFAYRTGYDNYPRYGKLGARPGVTLGPGERKTVTIPLAPFGVITGRILEADGDPIPDIKVTALSTRYAASGRTLRRQATATSNDLGEYRIYNLPRGRYLVRAEPPGGPQPGPDTTSSSNEPPPFLPAYYPGTADTASAGTVPLSTGQQASGMDIVLRRGRLATITGRVVRPEGATAVGVELSGFYSGASTSFGTDLDDAEGTYAIQNVSPGAYVVSANYLLNGKRYETRQPIQVGVENIHGIHLTPVAPVDIAGIVRVDANWDGRLSSLEIRPETDHSGVSPARVDDTGAFVVRDAPGAVYRFSVTQVSGTPVRMFYVKSIRIGGIDVTETGLNLTAGPPKTGLTIVAGLANGIVDGVVYDDKSEPFQGSSITLVPRAVPARAGFRPFALGGSDYQGHFVINDVPPGRYRIYAWDAGDREQVYYNPEYLEDYQSAGQDVEVAENGKVTLTLRVIHNPDN